MHIRLECRPTNIRCCSQSKKKEHQNFFSRVSSRIPSENRFLQNLTSWGMVITFLYCFTVSDAIIVTEVEIFSRLILIFFSDIPGSSVTMRRNFPSSKRVVIGSIDFIGMVLSELTFSIFLFLLSLPGIGPGVFFPVLFNHVCRGFYLLNSKKNVREVSITDLELGVQSVSRNTAVLLLSWKLMYESIGCVFTSEVLTRGGEKGVKFNSRTEPSTRLSIRAALCGASTKSDKAFFFSEVPFHLPRVRLCPSITCT